MYMDSEYWQVVAEEGAREILEFFTSYGKWWCRVVSMGDQKCGSNFFSNDYEATNGMRYISKGVRAEIFHQK